MRQISLFDFEEEQSVSDVNTEAPTKLTLFQYILNCIDPTGYDKELSTDYEKIQFLNETFHSEFWKTHQRLFKDDERKGFAEWIPGLPSSFNVDYANHTIIDVAIEMGLINESRSESEEDEFIEGWYGLIADNFLKIREEMKKEAPLSNLAIETLKNSKVEGLTVKLPEGHLDRKIYLEVKQKLELIGGKWKGGKTMGFVFMEDPTTLLNEVASGQNRNLKKEFQFFATPDELADQLVNRAFECYRKDYCSILEPSAGQGAIIKAIQRKSEAHKVYCFEAMSVNKLFLDKLENVNFLGEDFLTCTDKFDLIIANPPFSKNQDIDHVNKMWECLNPGGRIVSITSKHWQTSSNKKETDFKRFLDEKGALIDEIDMGAFKESGTMVGGLIVIIDK
jgi:predicted RNA methylase